MLKVGTQLDDALTYQLVVGAERSTGHFDDGANAISGPVNSQGKRIPPQCDSSSRVNGVGAMRVRIDPETGDLVGFFATSRN